MPSFANGVALFFAIMTVLLLVIAWAMHAKEEAKMRLFFVTLAVISGVTAAGAWSGGHWHG